MLERWTLDVEKRDSRKDKKERIRIRLTHLDLTVPAPSLPLVLGPPRPFVMMVVRAAFSLAAPCFSIHRLAKKPIA